jgi:hypothetical protein
MLSGEMENARVRTLPGFSDLGDQNICEMLRNPKRERWRRTIHNGSEQRRKDFARAGSPNCFRALNCFLPQQKSPNFFQEVQWSHYGRPDGVLPKRWRPAKDEW